MLRNLEPRTEHDVKVYNTKTDRYDIAHHGVFNPENTPKWTFYKNADETEKFGDEWRLAPSLCYDEFGLEMGEGWYKVVQPILDYVAAYNKDKPYREQIIIEQIKSKFGTLRVHINHTDEKVNELIKIAELEADQTCEICGSKHDIGLVSNGWITVECRDCFKKNKPGRIWRSYLDKGIWAIDIDGTLVPYRRN